MPAQFDEPDWEALKRNINIIKRNINTVEQNINAQKWNINAVKRGIGILVPAGLERKISARVNVFCHADRPWHRGDDSRKWWVADFAQTTAMSYQEPYSSSFESMHNCDLMEKSHVPTLTWGSVLHPRGREYSAQTKIKLITALDGEAVSQSTESFLGLTASSEIYSDVWAWELNDRIQHGFISEDDAEKYSGARERIDDAGQVSYLLSCPCGHKYRAITRSELIPVLDRLTNQGITEIEAGQLVRVLDAIRRGEIRS